MTSLGAAIWDLQIHESEQSSSRVLHVVLSLAEYKNSECLKEFFQIQMSQFYSAVDLEMIWCQAEHHCVFAV